MEPKKNWKYVPAPPAAEVEALGEALGLKNSYFLSLLVSRGIKTFEQVKDFMVPEVNQLHNPFLMKDMDKAVERLSLALESGEKILIYGDYDVDGTTAVTIVYSYLAGILGASFAPYIATWLATNLGLQYVGYYLTVMASISFFALILVKTLPSTHADQD
jgi:single-stranded-DNA-specific exonuclease